jgi:hypothetical protein
MGKWEARLVAFSFRHFVQFLENLRLLAIGRSNPVELEINPIGEPERDAFLEFIRRDSPDIHFGFWEEMFRVDT